MAFGITPTRLTSGIWGATKKAFSWADRKLGKGVDFIDEQWRTKAQPALKNTFGEWVMDKAANTVGSYVESNLKPAQVILDKTIPLLEVLPQGDTVKSITKTVRDTKDYFAKAGDMTRNYISPRLTERKDLPKKSRLQLFADEPPKPSLKDSIPALPTPINPLGPKPPSIKVVESSPRPKIRIRTQKMNSGRLKLTENPWTMDIWNGNGLNAKYSFSNQTIYGNNRG